MKRAVVFLALLVLVSVSFISCGGYSVPKPPSGLYDRVLASQDVSSLTARAGLVIIDAAANEDVLARRPEISAGGAPGLLAISPTRLTLLAFDSSSNQVDIVDTQTEAVAGAVQLPGPTTSMVIPSSANLAYAAVPTVLVTGSAPGAIEVMNLSTGSVSYTIGVPNAQTVVSNSDGSQLLVFSGDSDVVTVVSPTLINISNPVVTVPGFDRPVYAVFNGATAYVLNCGAQCGGTQASVQTLDTSTTPPTVGPSYPVDAATYGLLNGSTLYVAGTSPTNSACTGETTAAPVCGRLDLFDLNSLTVTSSLVITDGYHDRMDMSGNGQLFIGSHTCTSVGNVNNPQGEVRGCLSILNTSTNSIVIPPDNGDVTGLQGFTSRYVEYVAEGGNLRIYDTTQDVLQTVQITLTGQVIDLKAIDFF